ncbi:hypothetical protein A0H81_04367 [Grifola frondosa]|uniref:Uncharacterized protein n=1 Tax=Grifola frondosa TaxID=5627 RepID=A0A1C7MG97_GRIFR|nr:hypothetical protein A0H81_04367 [Grifola frondosa]
MNVEDAIFDCLAIFPLLSVVDLRGTRCLPYRCTYANLFHPCADSELYHPTPSALPSKGSPLSPSNQIHSSLTRALHTACRLPPSQTGDTYLRHPRNTSA